VCGGDEENEGKYVKTNNAPPELLTPKFFESESERLLSVGSEFYSKVKKVQRTLD